MRAVVVLIAFLFFLHFANPVFAAAPSITAYPSGTISLDTAFTVTATMSGLSKNAIYRLRVAISQPGTSNYFGSTYDGATWHMGSIADGNFVSITTDGNGAWGGNIQGKIDSDDPNFTTGSGTYDLKIGRYTQTGSTATWSNPVSITIEVPPTPTPTLTPTMTPTPTLTPIPTSTSTPTPTKTPTPTPIPNTPTSMPSPSPEEVLPTSVLGESTVRKSLASSNDSINGKNTLISNDAEKSDANFEKILIAIGFILLSVCGILIFRHSKHSALMI